MLLTEEGLVLSVDPIPGYTQEETEKLRRSDAMDTVSRARVSVRSCVPACPCAHDTCAGEKEKIRREKSRGNTHCQTDRPTSATMSVVEHYLSFDPAITNDRT